MYTNEQSVLKKLGISSWKYLSKENFKNFIAIVPKMSDEVWLKISEQIPNLLQLCTEGLNATIEAYRKATDQNEVITLKIIDSLDLIREAIAQGLNKEGISEAERISIRSQLIELAKIYDKLDERNKKFFDTTFGKILGVIAATALGVGVAVALSRGGESEMTLLRKGDTDDENEPNEIEIDDDDIV